MALDPQLTPPELPDPEKVKDMMHRWMLLGALGFFVGILAHVQDACRERTWKQRLTVLLTSGCMGYLVMPVATVFAPMVYPDISFDAQMAIGCVGSAMGGALLPMLNRWLIKAFTIKMGDPHDIDDCKKYLTPEQCARHADSCPFEPDRYGGKCMKCPHRKEQGE